MRMAQTQPLNQLWKYIKFAINYYCVTYIYIQTYCDNDVSISLKTNNQICKYIHIFPKLI